MKKIFGIIMVAISTMAFSAFMDLMMFDFKLSNIVAYAHEKPVECAFFLAFSLVCSFLIVFARAAVTILDQ